MIYRFNRYSKRNYIKKLLRDHEYFYLDEYYDEDINKVSDNILQMHNIKNYKNILKIYDFVHYRHCYVQWR